MDKFNKRDEYTYKKSRRDRENYSDYNYRDRYYSDDREHDSEVGGPKTTTKIISGIVIMSSIVVGGSVYVAKAAKEEAKEYQKEANKAEQMMETNSTITSQIELDLKTVKKVNAENIDIVVDNNWLYVNTSKEMNKEIFGLDKWGLIQGKVPMNYVLVTDAATGQASIVNDELVIILPDIRILENGISINHDQDIEYTNHPDNEKLAEKRSWFNKVFKSDKSFTFNDEDYSTLQSEFLLKAPKETKAKVQKEILENPAKLKDIQNEARKKVKALYTKAGVVSDIKIYFDNETKK